MLWFSVTIQKVEKTRDYDTRAITVAGRHILAVHRLETDVTHRQARQDKGT